MRTFERESTSGEGAKGEGSVRCTTWAMTAQVAEAHRRDVNCVRWSPHDVGLLASCSDDGMIKLWTYTEDV